jgi:adenosylmethionine-8-amino-7-oxononanoate aminotransferase
MPRRARFQHYAFHDFGLMVRVGGDTLAFSPPLIVTEDGSLLALDAKMTTIVP